MGELTIYLQIVLGSLLNKRSHVAFEAAIFFFVSTCRAWTSDAWTKVRNIKQTGG